MASKSILVSILPVDPVADPELPFPDSRGRRDCDAVFHTSVIHGRSSSSHHDSLAGNERYTFSCITSILHRSEACRGAADGRNRVLRRRMTMEPFGDAAEFVANRISLHALGPAPNEFHRLPDLRSSKESGRRAPSLRQTNNSAGGRR